MNRSVLIAVLAALMLAGCSNEAPPPPPAPPKAAPNAAPPTAAEVAKDPIGAAKDAVGAYNAAARKTEDAVKDATKK